MGATPRGDSFFGEAGAFDPMMGQLEVIEPGITMYHSFANVAFAYGGGEMLAADTSPAQMGALALKAIREVTSEPFAFLIYTHGHFDHAFGTEAFITDNLSRGYPRWKIWAHEDVAARFERYRLTRGWQSHINRLQFGVRIPPDAMFAGNSFTHPDLTYRDMQLLELEREPVELRHAMGETDDATWVWMPRRRLAMVGDLIVSSLRNTGNPNKVQRYTLEWAGAPEQIDARKPRIVLAGHSPAYRGEDICHELLTGTAPRYVSFMRRWWRASIADSDLSTSSRPTLNFPMTSRRSRFCARSADACRSWCATSSAATRDGGRDSRRRCSRRSAAMSRRKSSGCAAAINFSRVLAQ